MSRLLLALAGAVALSLFVAGVSVTLWPSAQADDEASATPQLPADGPPADGTNQTPPAIEEPPRAILRLPDGRELVGGAGTRCWGVCVDMVGPVSNADPYAVAAGEPITLEFEAGAPNSTYSAWIEITGRPGKVTGQDSRVWTDLRSQLSPDTAAPLLTPAEPGDYLYVVQAFYTGRGDVMYAFYVSID